MDNSKAYEMVLKINTYLRRHKVLSEKLLEQEKALTRQIIATREIFPPAVFTKFIEPIVVLLDNRVGTLKEMEEAAHDFMLQLQEISTMIKQEEIK